MFNKTKNHNRKLCYAKIKDKKNILFYAASMGESLSTIAFIKQINKHYEGFNIVIATQTHSSAKTVAKYIKDLNLKNTYHIYAVLDSPFSVNKFLSNINPCAVFWVESEFWYNHLRLIKKRNIPLVLLNARFSPRAIKRWQKFSFMLNKLLSYFDVITAKTQPIADSIKHVTGIKSTFIGDIKVASSLLLSKHLPCGELSDLKEIFKRPNYVAISTHKDEESQLASMHKSISKQHSNFLTVIIPRHVERAPEIVKTIKQQCLKVCLLSKIEGNNKQVCDILIIDKYGAVKDICALTNTAFVGKSISNFVQGGQNPYEPIFFGLNTIIGPNFQNFNEDVKELKAKNLITVINNKQELQQEVVKSVFSKSINNNKVDGFLTTIEDIPLKHIEFFRELLNECKNR